MLWGSQFLQRGPQDASFFFPASMAIQNMFSPCPWNILTRRLSLLNILATLTGWKWPWHIILIVWQLRTSYTVISFCSSPSQKHMNFLCSLPWWHTNRLRIWRTCYSRHVRHFFGRQCGLHRCNTCPCHHNQVKNVLKMLSIHECFICISRNYMW